MISFLGWCTASAICWSRANGQQQDRDVLHYTSFELDLSRGNGQQQDRDVLHYSGFELESSLQTHPRSSALRNVQLLSLSSIGRSLLHSWVLGWVGVHGWATERDRAGT